MFALLAKLLRQSEASRKSNAHGYLEPAKEVGSCEVNSQRARSCSSDCKERVDKYVPGATSTAVQVASKQRKKMGTALRHGAGMRLLFTVL